MINYFKKYEKYKKKYNSLKLYGGGAVIPSSENHFTIKILESFSGKLYLTTHILKDENQF